MYSRFGLKRLSNENAFHFDMLLAGYPLMTSMADGCSENRNISTTTTIEENHEEHPVNNVTVVRLKLKKPKDQKRVQWSSETIDNEHMNKRKSKCCCVYVKPHAFDESSSDTDDECEHCRGHVEVRNKTDHVHSTEVSNTEENKS